MKGECFGSGVDPEGNPSCRLEQGHDGPCCPTEFDQPGWQPSRWWRVTAHDGSIWCETSDESEARESMRPGDRLHRLFTLAQEKWIPQQSDSPTSPGGAQ